MTNKKTLLISTLCSGFSMWVLAGLWHNLALPNLYNDIHPHHEGIGLMLLAYLLLAFLLSIIFSWTNKPTILVADGLKLGALVGILWVLPHGLAMAGAHGTSVLYEFKNVLWHVVEQGVGGVIVALVFRRIGEPINA